jgi:hypothetical protein
VKGQFQWQKLILPVIAIAAFTFLVYTVMNIVNDPVVIQARAQWLESKAVEMAARQPILERLPAVFESGGVFAIKLLLSLSVFVFVCVIGYNMAVYATRLFLSNGVEFTKNANGQVTKYALVQPRPMPQRGLPAGKSQGITVDPPQPAFPKQPPQFANPQQPKHLPPEQRRSGKHPTAHAGNTPIQMGEVPLPIGAGNAPRGFMKDDPLTDLDDFSQ